MKIIRLYIYVCDFFYMIIKCNKYCVVEIVLFVFDFYLSGFRKFQNNDDFGDSIFFCILNDIKIVREMINFF